MTTRKKAGKKVTAAGAPPREPVCTCGVKRGFTMWYRRCPIHPTAAVPR